MTRTSPVTTPMTMPTPAAYYLNLSMLLYDAFAERTQKSPPGTVLPEGLIQEVLMTGDLCSALVTPCPTSRYYGKEAINASIGGNRASLTTSVI